MSPALRSVVGQLSDHPRFTVSPFKMAGRFDNGEEREIEAQRVHNTGTLDSEDRYLADVEGDVWVFTEAGGNVMCSSSASGFEAVAAFRALLGPAAFVVV